MKKPGCPLTLIILDGWGHHTDSESNAISKAHTPTWDALCNTYPHTLIAGAESAVGLPKGQMGNSEVGHLNIGAGRIVYQDLTRINAAIADGSFFSNPVLVRAITQAKNTEKAVHLLGLVSPGGVHSHENHLLAMIKLAAQHGISRCYIHAFLDGRDTPPRSAASSLQRVLAYCEQMQCGEIRSLIGRFYAMDRDKRWDRVEKAYHLLTMGIAACEAPDAYLYQFSRGSRARTH
jgi:2,3-bisphosphoglycerate-independent phosphoglycerate mutase